MKHSRWASAMLLITLGGLLAASFPSSATTDGSALNSGAESAATCKKTFTSGAGPTAFSWCYSPTGNIVKLSYPAGLDHVAAGSIHEGYVLCVGNTVEAWDLVSTDGGFGPATSGFNSVTRSSARLKLLQKFTTDAKRNRAIVSMKVTNISGISLSDVRVARFVDFDVDGTFNNRWDRSLRAVWASAADGASLTASTFSVPSNGVVMGFASPVCAPTTMGVPFTGDAAGQVTYNLGAIDKGDDKTVVFEYARH